MMCVVHMTNLKMLLGTVKGLIKTGKSFKITIQYDETDRPDFIPGEDQE